MNRLQGRAHGLLSAQQNLRIAIFLQQKLAPLMVNTLKDKQQQLSFHTALLNSVNPLDILQRGFAVIKNAEDKLIKDIDQVNKDDEIKVQLRSGQLSAKVNTIEPK